MKLARRRRHATPLSPRTGFSAASRRTVARCGTLKSLVDVEYESARMLAESVIDTDIDAVFELPSQSQTVRRQHVFPLELFEAREHRSATAPYGATDSFVYALSQFGLARHDAVVDVASRIVASHSVAAAQLLAQRPRRILSVETAVYVGGSTTFGKSRTRMWCVSEFYRNCS